jgi:DNA-binding MarR family transcriptional regulator
VTNISLTAKGRKTFEECDKYLKNNVREMLSALTPEELDDFSDSLIKLKEIGPKLY